jgi:protein gp37
MHPEWARSLRDQCLAAGVPFFFKQWGEWEQIQYLGQDGKPLLKISLPNNTNFKPSHREIVFTLTDVEDRAKSSVNMWRVGKKAAGDLLDGRQWHEFPKGVSA